MADTILTALIREAVDGVRPGGLPTMADLELHGTPGRALNAALESARLDLDATGPPPILPRRRRRRRRQRHAARRSGRRRVAEAARQSVESGFATLKVKAGAERETEVLVERIRAIRRGGRAGRPAAARRQRRVGPRDGGGAARGRRPVRHRVRRAAAGRRTTSTGWPSCAAGCASRSPPTRPPHRSPRSATLLAAEAVDALVVKPARVGGPAAVAEIAELAAERGVPVVVSTLFETGVGIAAALAVAAACPRSAGTRWADRAGPRAGDGRACSSTTCSTGIAHRRRRPDARPRRGPGAAASGSSWTSGRSSASGSTPSDRSRRMSPLSDASPTSARAAAAG